MKYSRLILGLLIIVAALWVIAGEQISGASSDAFVNARIVSVRAKVAGNLTLPSRALGSIVAKGETLGEVRDSNVDNIRLNDLLLESALKTSEITGLNERISAFKEQRQALVARGATYRGHRIEELETRLAHARRRLEILERTGGVGPDGQRLADTVDDTPSRLPGEPLIEALALEHARERVAVLEIALASAQDGVFLGDGYNDAPNAEQRAVELDGEIAQSEASLTTATADLAAIEARVSRERVHVNALTGGELLSPVNGLYWDVLQDDGVTVQRGDPILRLVDCTSTVVSVSVSENVYNTLKLGQPATFRPAGGSKVFDATVGRLAGAGAATVYEHLAVAPSLKHLERYDVTLIVPGLLQEPDLACAIGQTGRAFFDRRPLDAIRSLFD